MERCLSAQLRQPTYNATEATKEIEDFAAERVFVMIGDATATDTQGRRVPCPRVTLSILELLDGEGLIDNLPSRQDIASEGVDVDVCGHIVLARGVVGLLGSRCLSKTREASR